MMGMDMYIYLKKKKEYIKGRKEIPLQVMWHVALQWLGESSLVFLGSSSTASSSTPTFTCPTHTKYSLLKSSFSIIYFFSLTCPTQEDEIIKQTNNNN